jgi:diacylglycerol kinase (ATP)
VPGTAASDQPLAVLAHPAAGSGRVGRELPALLAALRAVDVEPLLLSTETREEAVGACRDAAASGAALLAVGGDGTVHLAVQAVAGTSAPLGIVPLGTGNDFADALGIPGEPLQAILDDLRAGRSTAVDAVRVRAPHMAGHAGAHTAWYAAILSVGFDSAVNARANRMRFPRGPRRYDLAIVLELARLTPYDVTMVLDEGSPQEFRWSGQANLVAIGNTRSYGGGLRMCPAADPFDGVLDLTVVEPVTRWELMRVKPRLYDGTHIQHPKVRTYRARTVTIDLPGSAGGASGRYAYADGEPRAPLPLSLECVPAALRILGVPTLA